MNVEKHPDFLRMLDLVLQVVVDALEKKSEKKMKYLKMTSQDLVAEHNITTIHFEEKNKFYDTVFRSVEQRPYVSDVSTLLLGYGENVFDDGQKERLEVLRKKKLAM